MLAAVEPTGLLAGNLAGVAALLFVLLPERHVHGHGERWTDYGLPWSGATAPETWRAWGRGLAFALAVGAVVFPALLAAIWAGARLRHHLPPALAGQLLPLPGAASPVFRLPPRLPLVVLVQLLVVALPEELFYRGWMQTTWAATDPARGLRVLGARLGAGFVSTQALFAVGHLLVPQPWRLATFLPGLLFGWARERSGGLAAPVFLHALSNLFLAVLEASLHG